MNKQTKQLLLLAGLAVVAGGVAAWRLGLFGGDDAPAPANTANTAKINTPAAPGPSGPQPAGPQPAGPQPAAGGPQPAGGAQPEAKVVDKEIPPETKPPEIRYSWPWDPIPENPPEDYVRPFDPLFVQNIDVVDPKRKEYIEQLKQEWVLEGISETWQEVKIIDDQGNEIGRERMLVMEAWFEGKKRTYKEKDRLTNTRFQIEKIFIDNENGTSGVVLLGDTGARVTMLLAPPDRYGE